MADRDEGESLLWELERHIATTEREREGRASELDLSELNSLIDLGGLADAA
jgi:hypothetical protein